jgi:hypothetical protein
MSGVARRVAHPGGPSARRASIQAGASGPLAQEEAATHGDGKTIIIALSEIPAKG